MVRRSFPIRKLALLALAICTCSSLFGQSKPREIKINHADVARLENQGNNPAKRLIGHVQMEHDGVIMTCDSAWHFSVQNAFQAFGNVVIRQNDTLTITGDSARYDGKNKKAYIFHNVHLQNTTTQLNTDYLIYDLDSKQGRYLLGGTITDKNNQLSSRNGTYDANSASYAFKDSVVLHSKQYTILTDTLHYNTRSHQATFLGPTRITGENTSVYCENGFYNTSSGKLEYYKNVMITKGDRSIGGDSIVYDEKTGIGQIYGRAIMIDTAEHTMIRGDYASYLDRKDSSFVTGNALLVMVMDGDSMFLHADTLTSKEDTITKNRTVYAYHHVKFFKSDMQGKCDSLTYRESDSTMYMFGTPILWSEENQITAANIRIRIWDDKVQKMFIEENAFIVSQEDSSKYNQIKGRMMTGFFLENALSKIWVEGNGQTIYFPKSEKGFIGVNRADCSNLWVRMQEGKVHDIVFMTQPDATLYPLEDLPPPDRILRGFQWLSNLRPYQKGDVFSW